MTDTRFLSEFSNTYANIFSFCGLPLSRDLAGADAVVMGVPFDLATTGRSGSRFGPSGVRQASAQLRWEHKRWPWPFALGDKLKAIDYGDIVFRDGDSAAMAALVEQHADYIVSAGKTLLTLGGDHFITLPLLRAHVRKHGPVALLHFDAHTDTEATDFVYNHGAMFHHAVREGLLDTERSIQVGIRTEYTVATHPFEVLDAAWMNNHSLEQNLERIRARVGGAPVYLSFDIDCLDPAFAPGTGTPVMGGLTSDRALQIIRGLGDLNIIGMDVMEVAPCYDHAEITSLAGATLALEMLYLLAARKK
ncbi:agmatinase [Microbulbifer harenosus]|uniref:Agmatinase n=1 Tax=Microbulbifer harenosus TaxID=2576840 RepID=A0ABY2UME5_9GAMM|nr:agmatinase [Microbulbifer harenosus]TLM78569.1 agmatinase [Microbulbifer harenosus]